MATDAEVRNLISDAVCLRFTNEWSRAQIAEPAVSWAENVIDVSEARGGHALDTTDWQSCVRACLKDGSRRGEEADKREFLARNSLLPPCGIGGYVQNLRRAYEWQIASPRDRWSRLPRNLSASARLHFFIP